jgi:hypothetical protein
VSSSKQPPVAPELHALPPETGGRFSLALIAEDALGAHFDVVLVTSVGSWNTQALVSSSQGEVSWSTNDLDEAPPWLRRYAHAALRSAWRQVEEQGWPRRVTRWRDAPERNAEDDPGDVEP